MMDCILLSGYAQKTTHCISLSHLFSPNSWISISNPAGLKERLNNPVIPDFRVEHHPEEGACWIPDCLDA